MHELTEKLHDAVEAKAIASVPAQRAKARLFQLYVVFASAAFISLAVAAHFIPYFPIDLTITREVQSYHGAAYDAVMRALSGLRWEAVGGAFAGLVSVIGAAIKLLVYRPRPSADLVYVFRQLPDTGFPSGHVLSAVAFGGYMGFLAYTLLKPSWQRTVILILIALGVVLMGPSRIYMGQHWFSDTMGAYVLGSLWLALSIKLYRRLRHKNARPD